MSVVVAIYNHVLQLFQLSHIGLKERKNNIIFQSHVLTKRHVIEPKKNICLHVHIFGIKIGRVLIAVQEIVATTM